MSEISFGKQAIPLPRLRQMNAALRSIQAHYRELQAETGRRPQPGAAMTPDAAAIDASWRLRREEQAELKALLGTWTRAEREALLLALLPRGSAITLDIPDHWLDQLIIWRPARVLEAQRVKNSRGRRLSDSQKECVAEEGDCYWLRLAQSYQGSY